MARQLGASVQNHFGGGFVTEATGLNFPPNACTSTENCIFTQKQSVTPRFGFNYESGNTINNTHVVGNAVTEFYWQNAAGLGNTNFAVVQNGVHIYFYNASFTQGLSAGLQATVINLDSLRISGAPTTATIQCSFASGNGYLFIAHSYIDPIYVKYDPIAGTLTPTQVTLQQRDVAGTSTDEVFYPWQQRPKTLSAAHYYNLANQGWIYPNGPPGYFTAASTPAKSYIELFKSGAPNLYPSNADIWWTFKNAGGAYDPHSAGPGQIQNNSLGNTPAPKGHFILSCFNQDRSGALAAETTLLGYPDQAPGIPIVSASYYRPSVVAFFAGRAWFAGVNFGSFTNSIYYSQIIQQDQQIGFCYQSNDPTSDDTNVADLLASDGGVLIQPEIGQIYKLYPVAFSLLVFASNGIWAISGSTGTGFTATDFSVAKISTVNMVSQTSFVDVDGIPMWWNYEGIYTLSGTGGSTSPAGGAGTSVVSITDETIKTFFVSLPAATISSAKGSYNRRLYTVYWIYDSTGSGNTYSYNSALCLNTVTRAFYPWTLPSSNGVFLAGLVTVQGQGLSTVTATNPVVDNLGAPVVDQLGNQVFSNNTQTGLSSSTTKFLAQTPSGITFAEVADPSLIDFNNTLNLPYTVFAKAGYMVDQNPAIKWQAPYLVFYIYNTLQSSLQVNAAWDFANNISTGKVTSFNTFFTEGGNYDYVSFRRKIRGEGRALSIEINGISGQWFEIAGWAIESSKNTQV